MNALPPSRCAVRRPGNGTWYRACAHPSTFRRHLDTASARLVAKCSESHAHLIVVGSINVDTVLQLQRIPAPGETLGADGMERHPGGKGANQAAAAAKLGQSTMMIGQVGPDDSASYMLGKLQEAGVKTQHVREVDDCTGSAIILLQDQGITAHQPRLSTKLQTASDSSLSGKSLSAGENSIIIVGGANMSSWELTPQQRDALAHAGCVLLQREIPDAVNEEVAALCKASGVPVILDVGGRDGPMSDALLQSVTTLSPNETELARITGMPTGSTQEVQAAAQSLLDRGVSKVLVKLGKQGSFMLAGDGETMEQAAFLTDNVVDTTGAGDCYTAAYAVAQLRGQSVAQSMRFASAASCVAVQRMGAMSSMPSSADIEAVLSAHDLH